MSVAIAAPKMTTEELLALPENDPHDRTVLIYRPGAELELVNVRQELSGEPELPGFRVAVMQMFV